MHDLHTHSVHSDGVHPPAEVVARAAAAGLAGLALTDHDTTAGWAEAATAAEAAGLAFLGGIELSTEQDGKSVHVLGYGLDPADPALVAELRRLTGERRRRAEVMLARLEGLGVSVDLAAVEAIAGDAAIARPHLAEALVAAGHVADAREAFDVYLGDGAAAYEPKRALAPEDGVRLIVAAGGVAVLAHPGLDRGCEGQPVSTALLDRLVAAGLAGVESDHPGHDTPTRDRWRSLAADRGLAATGGSDYHGRYDDEEIGRWATTAETVARLLGGPEPERAEPEREGVSEPW